VPHCLRSIWFFQCSFVDAISKWNIGSEEERAIIVENKNRRADFSRLTDEIKEYCALECRLLAMLMEKFRETCMAFGRGNGAVRESLPQLSSRNTAYLSGRLRPERGPRIRLLQAHAGAIATHNSKSPQTAPITAVALKYLD
jgi:hypothetical protein